MDPSQNNGALELYVVYDRPKDFPDKWVVRKFLYDKPTDEHWTYVHLNAARAPMIARGLVRIPANPTDDPVILETWM
jgi:hypothetical protein